MTEQEQHIERVGEIIKKLLTDNCGMKVVVVYPEREVIGTGANNYYGKVSTFRELAIIFDSVPKEPKFANKAISVDAGLLPPEAVKHAKMINRRDFMYYLAKEIYGED